MKRRDDSPERVYALLVESNPVADEKPTTRPHLAVVDPRRTEMNPPSMREERNNRPWMIGIAAVILAVVATTGLLLLNAGDDAPVATTPTTEATTPTTTATASTGITVEYLDGQWQGAACFCMITFENGTYEVAVIGLRGLTAVDQGTVQMTDDLMTFVSSEDSANCEPGDERVFKHSSLSPSLSPSNSGADRFQLVSVSDDCADGGTLAMVEGPLQADGNVYETLTRSP